MRLIDFIIEKIEVLPKIPSQILLSTFISIGTAIPISLFDRFSGWYIDNQMFLTMVFLAVAIDHVLGSFVHLTIKHDFSMKKNIRGLLVKGFAVVAGYVLFEMIRQIVQDVQFIAIYFKVVLQLTVILYPTISAMKNLSIITNGSFPPSGIFKKFNKFNEDLDINTFKTNNQNEENNNFDNDNSVDDELQNPKESNE